MSRSPADAKAPLRVLMAAPVSRRREGGSAIIAYHLGEGLERSGHSVAYIFQEDLFGNDDISPRFSTLIFASRLNRYISERRNQFDIVNLHAPSGFFYGFHRRWFPSAQLPPQVMTLHGLEERRVHVQSREHKKHHAWNFNWRNRLWHRVYTFPLYRWTIRNADGAHTYSRDVWNMLQLKYNLDSDRVAYIPNGVEPRFFEQRRYDTPGPFKLLYAGTWLDQRGIFYLRDALEHLAPQLPGLTITFAGCGCPPDVIQSFFGPKLASNIVIEPVVPSEQMHQVFSAHDVFLFPSLMEGLPSVLLEAMASGMPVITAETCGMPDVVEDGFNGLLVPPADASAIEQAVLRLAHSPDLRKSVGEAARQTMSRYTWERAALKLEQLFRHVIALEGQSSE
ncbi:MAG TPA: glycosyltransferase family 4 protein [Candidatus Saccharimonadales bacterium]|nr:glycosyltransferase family 4 protein [Candidatus Saccharimonadales bacterium]